MPAPHGRCHAGIPTSQESRKQKLQQMMEVTAEYIEQSSVRFDMMAASLREADEWRSSAPMKAPAVRKHYRCVWL